MYTLTDEQYTTLRLLWDKVRPEAGRVFNLENEYTCQICEVVSVGKPDHLQGCLWMEVWKIFTELDIKRLTS